jgi:hypothetical protein
MVVYPEDHHHGLVIRVPGYSSRGPGFLALPDFLRSSGLLEWGLHSLMRIIEELLE